MEPREQIELMAMAAEKQMEMAHRSLEQHLNESDQIHARDASQTIVDAAKVILTNPTEATP